MSAEAIRTEVADGVLVATLDVPPINLMGGELLGALDALGQSVAADDAVKVVVLRSAHPDFFVAHGDVETMAPIPVSPFRRSWDTRDAWRTASRKNRRTRPGRRSTRRGAMPTPRAP